MESATSIASQVRTGRRSAVDIVAEALEAAESTHNDLNAFTLINTSGALHRAEAIDRLVAAGKDPGPLSGVPIALKDIIDEAGLPTTNGSSFPTPFSETSSAVVRRLGLAGAVIIGRTGLHEFAFGFTSENPWFGPVRNPWDVATSPGGSSGGSAAAVAAGVVPVAIGTDTGGSVRVPAAMCGILGLKVTHGRVPLSGVFPLAGSLDTVGPLARTIEDLTATYLAIAGDDPSDPWSQPQPVETPPSIDISDIRLGVVQQWHEAPIDSTIAAGLEHFCAAATAAGADVVIVDEPSLAVPPSVGVAYGPEIWAVHEERFTAHPERYGADTAERLMAAREGSIDELLDAERWASGARATIDRLVSGGITALVAPTVGVLEKAIGSDSVDVDGTTVPHRLAMASFTAPINRVKVPAIAAPIAGTPRQGVSLQLIGQMWAEATLLSVVEALTAAGVLEASRPPVFSDESAG